MKRACDDCTIFEPTVAMNVFYKVMYNTVILSVLQRYLDAYDIFSLSAITSRMYNDWTAKQHREDALRLRQHIEKMNWRPPAEGVFFWVRARSLFYVQQRRWTPTLPCWKCNMVSVSFVNRDVFPRQTCTACAYKCFLKSDGHVDPSSGLLAEERNVFITVRDACPFKRHVPVCFVMDYICLYFKMARKTYIALDIPFEEWAEVTKPLHQSATHRLASFDLIPVLHIQEKVRRYMEKQEKRLHCFFLTKTLALFDQISVHVIAHLLGHHCDVVVIMKTVQNVIYHSFARLGRGNAAHCTVVPIGLWLEKRPPIVFAKFLQHGKQRLEIEIDVDF